MIRIISEEPKILNDPNQKRRKKALELFENHKVGPMNRQGTEFKVKSSKEGHYLVTFSPELGLWSCRCEDYAYCDVECKHILASKYFRHEMSFV